MRLFACTLLAALLPAAALASSYYGLQPMPEGPATPVSAALADFDAHAEGRQKFSGRIVEVCQKKGCWIVLEDAGSSARVMMHDHQFDVPKDATGPAVVFGQLSRRELSEAQREHLQGDSAHATEVAEVEYRIDAFAVVIGG